MRLEYTNLFGKENGINVFIAKIYLRINQPKERCDMSAYTDELDCLEMALARGEISISEYNDQLRDIERAEG